MPKISYCCIFKNEEKNLGKWAESALGIADEIIAVDTGSTDKSCEILREYGIEPLYFEWKDDFSAAKNFALSKATGDWIFFPDADEYFSKEDGKTVKSLVNKLHKNKKIKIIDVIQHNIDADNDNKIISDMNQSRVFRNLPTLKYVKRIHEHLHYAGNDPFETYSSGILLIHTGYSESVIKAKATRNLELLERDTEAAGKITPLEASYMATSYTTLEDFPKVIKYAKIALAGSDAELYDFLAKTYFLLCKAQTETGASYDEIISTVEEGLRRTKNYPDLLYVKLKLLFSSKNYAEAEETARLFFDTIKDTALVESQDHFFEGFVWEVRYIAAQIQFIKNDTDNTANLFEAFSAAPDKTDSMGLFVKYFRDKDTKETAAAFDRLCKGLEDKDRDFLRTAFQNLPYGEKYLELAQPKPDSYQYFLCKGDVFEAFKSLISNLHSFYKILVPFYNYYNTTTNMEFFRETIPQEFFSDTTASQRMVDINKALPRVEELQHECVSIFLGLNQNEYAEFAPFLKYLSKDNRSIVAAAFEGEATIRANNFVKCFRSIRYTASVKVLARLSLIALGLGREAVYTILDELMERREFDACHNILQRVPLKDDNFFAYLGKICYYKKEIEAAKDAFSRVTDKSNETKSFTAWCK